MTYYFWISYPYFNLLFSNLRDTNTNAVDTVLVLGTSFKIVIVTRIVFLY